MTTPAAPEVDPAALLSLATTLAIDAGRLLVDGLDRTRTSIQTKSTGTDMVTEMDRASERLIVEGILATRPHDGIVGEEGTERAGTSGVRWIIDPLDGTTNYIYGFPGFGVSIAAEGPVPGMPNPVIIAGVVVDPLHDDVFAAARGQGATRNGSPIRCSDETELGRALVATGFGYDAAQRGRQGEVVGRLLPQIRDIRRMGAAAVDLCSLACGRVDAYFERGLAHWDYAAGSLIATEAGAVVGDLEGGPCGTHFTMGATAPLFDRLRTALRAAGAGQT